jgi:hypothetical protein
VANQIYNPFRSICLVEFTKKESYAIQIEAYLRSGQISKAVEMADCMVKKYPDEPLSHFMAAKSHFFGRDYERARAEGLQAYNGSHEREDMLVSAIVAASASFMLGRYDDGFRLLLPFRMERNAEVKKLLVMFYSVKEEGAEAAQYFQELYDLNSADAERFVTQFAEGAKPGQT